MRKNHALQDSATDKRPVERPDTALRSEFDGAAAPRDERVSRPVEHRVSPVVRWTTLVVIVGLCVPVGMKIRTAMAHKAEVQVQSEQALHAAQAAANAPIAVSVVHPVPTTHRVEVPLEGTLAPLQEADLAFKATGALAVLKVKAGDVVKQGALLGVLDSTEASASSQAAAAQIKAAEAQLLLAQDAERRTTAMVKSGAAPEAQATQAVGQLSLAQAQLDSAKAQAAVSAALLRNHVLVAPFSGVVTKAPSGVGTMVTAGSPQFHLKDLSRLKLVGTIGEIDADLVKIGSEVVLAGGRRAKVTAILPSVDPATRRIPVEAELDNADASHPLLAGTFVRANVRGGEAVPVLRVPGHTLRPGSQDELVTVRDGRLVLKKAVFVRTPDGELLVRSGIAADDALVLSPSAEAKEGSPVTVTEATAPAASIR